MKLFKRIIIAIVSIVVLVVAVVGGHYLYSEFYTVAVAKEIELTKETKTLTAHGKGLYDTNGDLVVLNGINYGNWLLQESWMSVNSIGVEYNDDGSYVKINNQGTVESYLEMSQDQLDEALANNPNLSATQIETLWDTYYYSYCKEEDFENIKNVGFNMIRLPVYYRNFLKGDNDNLTLRDDAFELVDYFLENCKKYGLYCIIDMHGVPGGQNGLEHSGTFDNEFFTNEKYIQITCDLWKTIAKHYKEDRPDLYGTIAGYDLLNEPQGTTGQTGELEWQVMDRLYDAIRSVDQDHVVIVEGCWGYDNLPDPKKYGWENVMYELHFYNWNSSDVSYELFFMFNNLDRYMNDFNFPYYIGEFTFFSDEAVYLKYLKKWNDSAISWSVWSYKTISVGWWDSSWGLYVQKLELYNENLKLDVRTATYDEIYEEWSNQDTSDNFETGFLHKTMTKFFAEN